MSDTSSNADDQNEPTGSFQNFINEGDILSTKGEYLIACQAYSRVRFFLPLLLHSAWQGRGEPGFLLGTNAFLQALRMKPTDKAALISRARCWILLGKADKALEDADKTLESDPTYYKGLLMKAESLFASAEFEYALIYYHRGASTRPDIKDFRLGIEKCKVSINDSIDAKSIAPLTISRKRESTPRIVMTPRVVSRLGDMTPRAISSTPALPPLQCPGAQVQVLPGT